VVTTRNDTFQQWSALLTNRTKRFRSRSFLVQGVTPIDVAVAHHWPLRALLYPPGTRSRWADGLVSGPTPARRVELAPALLAELGAKDGAVPEVVAVAAMPDDDLRRIGPAPTLVVIADRPANPGNLGSLIRSADALGANGVVVAGHAVDPYDPRVIRASRGSLLAIPTIRVTAADQVLDWLAGHRVPPVVVGTGEDGDRPVWDHDFAAPTALVVGNEAAGMSRAWVEACSVTVRIPMVGTASSLNAAVAGSMALYEVFRQRAGAAGRPDDPAP